MSNPILIKRSSVASKAPIVGDLQLGELALNTFDGKLFLMKNNGIDVIVEVGAVTTVAGRTGNVVLISTDVTSALGFTPINKAGDTFTGSIAMNNNQISGIKVAGFTGEYNVGNVATTATVNFSNGQKQKVMLTGNATLTISAAPLVGHYQLRIIQDTTGSRTLSYSGISGSRWVGSATAPSINALANGESILNLFWDGVNYTQSLAKIGA